MPDPMYPVKPDIAQRAHIRTMEEYQRLYRLSLDNPEWFWGEQAKTHLVSTPGNRVRRRLRGGGLRLVRRRPPQRRFNCVDRHLGDRGDQTALIWAQDEPGNYSHITYRELKHHVARFANVLLAHGVKRGDRVCLYMPMMPELVYTMLACARIGAVHSVVFAGFSAPRRSATASWTRAARWW